MGLVIAPDNLLPKYTFLLEQATHNLGCGFMTVALCANKVQTGKILSQNGIPVPGNEGTGKRVIKPVKGCGAQGVRLSEDMPGEGEFAQDYIEGEHYSVSIIPNRVIGDACLYFSGNPPLVLAVNKQEIAIGNDGSFRYLGGETPVHPAREAKIVEIARKTVEILGCQGYCGVDVVVADKVYVVDVNPRITTSLVGIAACMQEEIAGAPDRCVKRQRAQRGPSHRDGPVRYEREGYKGMIGIDVGGANLKVVDGAGVHIHYCPLWEKAPITTLLETYASGKNDPAAVVMSGELADCFNNKMDGISFIVDAVRNAFPAARFYGTDAAFHAGAVPELAAANWLASADYLRAKYSRAVLLDIGSTTADIIPLGRFDELCGLTDLARLQHGFLVYTGMLRTNVAALLRTVDLDGIRTPVSSEFFATSADAHLALGTITAEEYGCDTPDHKEKTREASLRRLARVVCADLEEIGEAGSMQIARQFRDAQCTIVCEAVRACAAASGADSIIVAGIGAPFFARQLGAINLNRELGPVADALPAFAVREIALREGVFSEGK